MIALAKSCASQFCQFPPVPGEKYCPACRKAVLKELRESGYLTKVPKTKVRTEDEQEDVNETKFGVEVGVYGPEFDRDE